MTAYQVLRDQLDDIKARMKDLDEILRGRGKTPGLISEYERHDDKLTRLYAVVFQDSTGKHGLLHEVDAIRSGEMGAERKWKFWTAVLVAFITTAGLVFTNIDKIEKFFGKGAKPDRLDVMIKRAKRKQGKPIIRYRVIEKPAQEATHGPSEDVPERRGTDGPGME